MFRLHSLLLIGLIASAVEAERCPEVTAHWPTLHQENGGFEVSLSVDNQSALPLKVFWVSFEGDEVENCEIESGGSIPVQTYSNHHFRIYGKATSGDDSDDDDQLVLLKEHKVAETPKDAVLIVGDCDEIAAIFEKRIASLDEQMRALAHDQAAPCLPQDDSSKWSCVHHISKQDYEARLANHAGTLYGFNSTEEALTRDIGETVDKVWSHQIPLIPRISQSPGYLKMSFTKRMQEVLLPWYGQHKKGGPQDSVYEHRVIPGGFTNSHTIPMSIVNLDLHPDVKKVVVEEMHQVLEWWTGHQLVPTATFGIRIYHRDSMLINHVDRSDTHLASVVIQIGQDGVDQGWPLEVLHQTDGSCSEVYLQPGEMVLYEGARFRHGRPMRFQGDGFANIFSHFRPLDWHGPNESPNYDGKLSQDGYVKETGDGNEEL